MHTHIQRRRHFLKKLHKRHKNDPNHSWRDQLSLKERKITKREQRKIERILKNAFPYAI